MTSRIDQPPGGKTGDQPGPVRILVVEDSPDHTELLIRAFRNSPFPFAVSTCVSVSEARRKLGEFTPDLVLADMQLPDGKGIDLLVGPGGRQPLVLMTSFGDENQAVQAMKAGSLDYVVKGELSFAGLPDICRRAVRDWRAIVEKEAAREALARSEGRYRSLFENVPAGIFQCDADGQIMSANPALAKMLGYTEPGGLKDLKLLGDVIAGGRDAPASLADLDRTGMSPELEVEMKTADGDAAIILMTARMITEGGEVCRYEGFCIDVTKRRKADAALAESRLRFEATFRGSFGFMAIVDTDGRLSDINESALRATGCAIGDVTGKAIWEMPWWQTVAGQPEATRAGIQRALCGEIHQDQTVFRGADGALYEADRSFTPVIDRSGQLKFVVLEGRDVTDFIKASKRLEQSEQRMSALVENATAGILEIDRDGRVVSANPAAVAMLGHNEIAELNGHAYLDYVSETDKEVVARRLEGAWSGHDASCTYRVVGLSEERVLAGSFVTIRAADGSVDRVAIMGDDITERERNVARIRAEMNFSEAVINSLPGIFYVIDEQRRLVRWNDNFSKITGFSNQQFGKLVPLELFAEADRAQMQIELQNVMNGAEGRIEVSLIGANGEHIPFLLTGVRLLAGNNAYMVGMGSDISQRRQFEAQLRASEYQLRSIIESEPECVWTLDRHGRLLNINSAGRRMLGEDTVAFVREESVAALVDPEHQRAFRELIDSVFDGHSGILTFSIKTRQGRQRWLETHAVALRNVQGEIAGQLAVTRDVTAKREADRKIGEYSSRLQTLSQRLLDAQEVERRHVARELHDEVGQSLTALKLDLEAASHARGNNAGRLSDSLKIVEKLLEQVRGMSLDLRPSILDDFGLLPALRWYVDRLAARSGIVVSLFADTLTGVRLAAHIETASFRIVQEALTNTLRHAGANKVRVLMELESAKLWIHIKDNGVGFDSDNEMRSSTHGKSFGLLGMHERAVLLGGQVEIASTVGKGTEVIAWLPLAERDTAIPESGGDEENELSGLPRPRARYVP